MGKQTLANLKQTAKELQIKGRSKMTKEQLILAIDIYETYSDQGTRDRRIQEMMNPRGGGGGGGGDSDRELGEGDNDSDAEDRGAEDRGDSKVKMIEYAMSQLGITKLPPSRKANDFSHPDPMMPVQRPLPRKTMKDFLRDGPMIEQARIHQPLDDEATVQWKVLPEWIKHFRGKDPLADKFKREVIEANRKVPKLPRKNVTVVTGDGGEYTIQAVQPGEVRRGTRWYLNHDLWYDWGTHDATTEKERGEPKRKYIPQGEPYDPIIILDKYEDYWVAQRYKDEVYGSRHLSEPFRISKTHSERLARDDTMNWRRPPTSDQEIAEQKKRADNNYDPDKDEEPDY